MGAIIKTLEQASSRSLLFFFKFKAQKVVQKCTHQRHSTQLNQCRCLATNCGLNHISAKLKLKCQGNPPTKCQTGRCQRPSLQKARRNGS